MMLALVPIGDNKAEKKLTEELDGLPYSKYAMSLSSILPDGIPEEIVPHSLVKKLHSTHWARIIVNVRSPGESKEAFGYANEIRSIIKKYYPNQTTYLTGLTPSTQDIKQVITKDYSFVNILSLLGVALVIAITYKSLVLPFIVLIPIEAAVFINTAIPYVLGNRTMFLGFIIVSCVQLGATVDYSILLTGNYLDARTRSSKKEAAICAVTQSALPIMTSGLILTTVGYGQYFLTSIAAIASLGELIGRGAFISTLLVLFLLPACLMMFDCLIMKGKRLSYIHDIKSKPPRISIWWARHLMSQLPKQHHGGHLHDWGDRFRNCRKPSHLFSAHCSKEEEHNDKRTR